LTPERLSWSHLIVSQIDYKFIIGQASKPHLEGVVLKGKSSGVTIATGVDLGQLDEKSFGDMKLPDALSKKLKPFVGLQGKAAADALDGAALKIDAKEAAAIDAALIPVFEKHLVDAYNKAVDGASFDKLIPAAQTVIADVAFQYWNLEKRTPKFWKLVLGQDFNEMVEELRDFKDDSDSRRKAEAKLLADAINAVKSDPKPQSPAPPATAPKDVSAITGKDGTRCFPFEFVPKLDWVGGRGFGAKRDGARIHAGCDLIAPEGTTIHAVADGKVIQSYPFYHGTDALEVDHGDFIVRYGEIKSGSAVKGEVKMGQPIAKVGKMYVDSMLHFEIYSGAERGSKLGLTVTDDKLTAKNKNGVSYMRRKDLLDPTPFLNVWKNNLAKK
jgi:murein DD-endopeptidase MepM/ murein hydrolase activator NlpD